MIIRHSGIPTNNNTNSNKPLLTIIRFHLSFLTFYGIIFEFTFLVVFNLKNNDVNHDLVLNLWL